MICHYCGAELADRSGFCLNCGTRQEQAAVLTAPVEKEQLLPVQAEAERQVSVLNEPELDEESLAAEFPTDFSLSVPCAAPALKLPAERGLGKMLLFGILTLGIYPVVIWSRIVTELDLCASRYDGRRTMPFFAMMLLAPVTLGIYPLVWMHKFCARTGAELRRRGGEFTFGARDFWLWNVLGSLILVGPFVFTHRLLRAMNGINQDFNMNG